MPGCLIGWVRSLGPSPSHPCLSFPQCLGGIWCLACLGTSVHRAVCRALGWALQAAAGAPQPPRDMWHHHEERFSLSPGAKSGLGLVPVQCPMLG